MITNKNNYKNKGSAIIITMLFGTVAVGLTLLIAVFALSDFNQVSSYDESNTSTYANQAATEFALRAYNYNPSFFSLACYEASPIDLDSDNIYLDKISNEIKSLLTQNKLNPCESTTNKELLNTTDANITTKIIAYFFQNSSRDITLYNGDSIKLALPVSSDQQTLEIVFKRSDLKNNLTPDNVNVDFNYSIIKTDGSNLKKDVLDGISLDVDISNSIYIPADASEIIITPIFKKIDTNPWPDEGSELNNKSSIIFTFSNPSQPSIIDSGITTIIAETEYGRVTTRTESKIDRRSGQLINQANYVLYGNLGGITQQ